MGIHIGKGTKLFVENKTTADQWDPLCFIEMTEPEPEFDETEITDSCSPGKDKEFMPTLKDNGVLSFTGNFDDDVEDKAKIDDLLASFNAGESRNFRVDNTQLATGVRKQFTGFLKKFVGPKFDGREESLKVMGEIKLSGPIVQSDIV